MKRFLSGPVLAVAAMAFAWPASAQQKPDSIKPAPVRLFSADWPTFPVDRVVAIVGDQSVVFSDVLEVINQRRAQGLTVPTDSLEFLAMARQVLNDLIDEEVLVQKAKELKVEVGDADLVQPVEGQFKEVHDRFKTEAEFRDVLKKEGIGTPEEFRKQLTEQYRRRAMQQRAIEKLRQDGKVLPAVVTEQQISDAFEKNKSTFPRRPATVTFRQVIVAPRASDAERARAKAKADSLLEELKKGADFEQVAKRSSMDQASKETGGDLGWFRRGQMVPEFERTAFAMVPGQLSVPIETVFGFHIIRVDRVKPAEVKARHILIRPKIDSTNTLQAQALADSVYTLWKGGASFDTLVAKFHDPREEKVIPTPFDRSQLPPAYAKAFEGKQQGDFVAPFPIEDARNGVRKFVVAQVTSSAEGGEYTVADLRNRIRDQLQEEFSMRRLLDTLRKGYYVAIKL